MAVLETEPEVSGVFRPMQDLLMQNKMKARFLQQVQESKPCTNSEYC
jgi:hypothetical protein